MTIANEKIVLYTWLENKNPMSQKELDKIKIHIINST